MAARKSSDWESWEVREFLAMGRTRRRGTRKGLDFPDIQRVIEAGSNLPLGEPLDPPDRESVVGLFTRIREIYLSDEIIPLFFELAAIHPSPNESGRMSFVSAFVSYLDRANDSPTSGVFDIWHETINDAVNDRLIDEGISIYDVVPNVNSYEYIYASAPFVNDIQVRPSIPQKVLDLENSFFDALPFAKIAEYSFPIKPGRSSFREGQLPALHTTLKGMARWMVKKAERLDNARAANLLDILQCAQFVVIPFNTMIAYEAPRDLEDLGGRPGGCLFAIAVPKWRDKEDAQTPRMQESCTRISWLLLRSVFPQTDMMRKVGSSRVDLQACKLEYSIVSPK